MKSTLHIAEVKTEKPFPKLMIDNDGMVVLFYEEEKGTVVVAIREWEVGYYWECFEMLLFKDLPTGSTVTLEA